MAVEVVGMVGIVGMAVVTEAVGTTTIIMVMVVAEEMVNRVEIANSNLATVRAVVRVEIASSNLAAAKAVVRAVVVTVAASRDLEEILGLVAVRRLRHRLPLRLLARVVPSRLIRSRRVGMLR